MKVVYYVWGHQLEEVAAQIQRFLDQRPGARVAALSHSAAPVQEQGQLDVTTWGTARGRSGRVAGSGVATLVYTVLLVLEDQEERGTTAPAGPLSKYPSPPS